LLFFSSTKATKVPSFFVSLSLIICSLHEGNVWYQAAWVFAYFISQTTELIVMNVCIIFYLCLYFGKIGQFCFTRKSNLFD